MRANLHGPIAQPKMWRRRTVILGAMMLVSHGLLAQVPGRTYRLGFLAFGSSAVVRRNLTPFLNVLAQSGFVEGKNLIVELRVAGTESQSLDAVAAELAKADLDVVFVPSPNGAIAMKRASSVIPIVALLGSDPVTDGLVASLSRPGGNVTGVNVLAIETNQKRLELLKELFPQTRRVRYLTQKANLRFVEETQPYATKLGLSLEPILFETLDELDAVAARPLGHDEAIMVGGTPVNYVYREAIVAIANRLRARVVYPSIEYAETGGLVAYGGDLPYAIGRAMQLVVRVLRGATPADLPFEQVSRTNLTVNLRTAGTLGIVIPQAVQVRADRLIQ